MVMRVIFTIILLSAFVKVYSQKAVTIYYDANWNLTTRETATYSRVGIIDTIKYQFNGMVEDRYLNGNLEMTGYYLASKKDGKFNFYYPDGKIKTMGLYKNNERCGVWINYYENGKVKDKLVFNSDFLHVLEYYDANGNQMVENGTGQWETQFLNDFSFDSVMVKGAFRNKLRDGKWNFYSKSLVLDTSANMRLECIETYDNGKFIGGKYAWRGGNMEDLHSPVENVLPETKKFKYTETWHFNRYASVRTYPFLKFLPAEDTTKSPVDSIARYQGGIDALIADILRNMKMSRSYINSDTGYLAMFTIMIDENGKLKITEDPNKKMVQFYPDNKVFYSQLLHALGKLPVWEPAMRNNQKVQDYFMISFEMKDKKLNIMLYEQNGKK
jgi:antitoxin component YwqK of YwqJK toxin-antitoxin module